MDLQDRQDAEKSFLRFYVLAMRRKEGGVHIGIKGNSIAQMPDPHSLEAEVIAPDLGYRRRRWLS